MWYDCRSILLKIKKTKKKTKNKNKKKTVAVSSQTQAFKNFATFLKCITKIDGTTIDDAESMDLVIPMYNLIECSWNYSETTRRL